MGFAPALTPEADAPGPAASPTDGHTWKNGFSKARPLHQSQVTKTPRLAAPVAPGVDQPVSPPASALAARAVFPAGPVSLGTRQAAIRGQVSAAQQARLPSGGQQAHFSVSAFSLKDPSRTSLTAKAVVPPVRTATHLTGWW